MQETIEIRLERFFHDPANCIVLMHWFDDLDRHIVAKLQGIGESHHRNVEMIVVMCDPANFNFHGSTPFKPFRKPVLLYNITVAHLRLAFQLHPQPYK